MELRLLTINTWKGDGAYRDRLALLQKQLHEIAPDVVLMQEVLRSPDDQYDTLQYLCESLGGVNAFVPMRRRNRMVEGNWVDCWSGMGCWSRYPIEATDAVELPSNEADGGRMGQILRINIQGRVFLFGNIHLSFLPDNDALKIAQLETLLQKMSEQSAVNGYFLAGDFNSLPDSKTMEYLHSQKLFAVQDSFADCHPPSEKGVTFPVSADPTGGVRIDYIFSLTTALVPPCPVRRAEVTLNRLENECYPSDHFGVLAQFEIPDYKG